MKYGRITNSVLGLGLLSTSILVFNQHEQIKSNQHDINVLEQINKKDGKKIEQLNTINTTYEKAITGYKEKLNKKEINIKNKNKKIRNIKNELRKTKLKLKRESIVRQGKVATKSASNSNSNWQIFNVSFYTEHEQSTGKRPNDPDYGKTSSGSYVTPNRTMACPKQYPFGTKIELEDIGVRVCEDHGGAINGNHLDVYVTSETEAMRLGRKQLKGRILK